MNSNMSEWKIYVKYKWKIKLLSIKRKVIIIGKTPMRSFIEILMLLFSVAVYD